MLIEELNLIKNSLKTAFKNFDEMKPYMLLKFCRKIILKEKDNFTQKELLSIINQVFETKISYITFNKFFHSFINKKRGFKIKNETSVENKEETSSSQNEEPEKIDDNIVSKKKIDDKKSKSVKAIILDVENSTGELIESKNRNRIK